MRPLPPSFFRRDTAVVARDLLGCRLVRRFPDGSERGIVIVETEAYLGVGDRAAHTWNGRKSARVAPMWGPGGRAYVYFVYGMHHCLNVVTRREGEPEAVLIRAGLPLESSSSFFASAAAARTAAEGSQSASGRLRTNRRRDFLIASGPAKLCRYLGVTAALSGASLAGPDLLLLPPRRNSRFLPWLVGPRVGVDYAGEAAGWPLRFAVADCPAVTRRSGLSPLQGKGGPGGSRNPRDQTRTPSGPPARRR